MTSWAQMKDCSMPTSHAKFLSPEIKRRTCLNLHVAQPPKYTLKRSCDRATDLLCDIIARFCGKASYSNFKTSKRISDHRKSEIVNTYCFVKMPYCMVPGCTNCSKKTKGSDISYHRLPNDQHIRRAWLGRVRRENLPKANSCYVCRVHFTPDCFEGSLKELFGMRQKGS